MFFQSYMSCEIVTAHFMSICVNQNSPIHTHIFICQSYNIYGFDLTLTLEKIPVGSIQVVVQISNRHLFYTHDIVFVYWFHNINVSVYVTFSMLKYKHDVNDGSTKTMELYPFMDRCGTDIHIIMKSTATITRAITCATHTLITYKYEKEKADDS